mmetsp:Transcript_17615/g.54659  ORF Transcript_17615/g.54659 Transcript_17615/m.54659 type:complete len:224 (-) Transcript_17615:361-1032(-)
MPQGALDVRYRARAWAGVRHFAVDHKKERIEEFEGTLLRLMKYHADCQLESIAAFPAHANDLLAVGCREARCRLVHKDDRWVGHDALTQSQPPALPAADPAHQRAAHARVGHLGQPHGVQQRGNVAPAQLLAQRARLRGDARIKVGAEARDELDLLAHRAQRVTVILLRHVALQAAPVPPRERRAHLATVDQHRALIRRRLLAADAVHQRRLTAAGRPHHRYQ